MSNENIVNESYFTEEDVKTIVKKCGYTNNVAINDYAITKASNIMLGFLAEYWKLRVHLIVNDDQKSRQVLNFFIKAVSRSNPAKAIMCQELKLFQKETFFYSVIKSLLELHDLKPWSAKLITALNDAIVFEDLNASKYSSRNKFDKFDMAHTLQALSALARFHASTIVYEESKRKLSQKNYCISDEYGQFLIEDNGYRTTNAWVIQCMNGALQAVKAFSKYAHNKQVMSLIDERWEDIWCSAMDLSDLSTEHRNVICHRDLWNNNILFRYKEDNGTTEIENCVFVDFQAFRCQPPAGDVMVLLYCNLKPKFRQQHMSIFLNHYYKELQIILSNYDVQIEDIMSETTFLESAEEQRKWGLIVCSCLLPQFWIDDYESTNIFCDNEQFDEILSKDKGAFITKRMETNEDYKNTLMEVFEEIIERYCMC